MTPPVRPTLSPRARRAVGSPVARVAVILLVFGATLVVAGWLHALAPGAAAPVFLVPVVAAAILTGTRGAVAVTVLAVVLYDFLLTEPRYALTIADPQDLIDLVVFLFVAAVVGRLTSLLRARADEAHRRAAESQALFAISRRLAVAADLDSALPDVLARLATEAEMTGAWVTIGDGPAGRTVAATGARPHAPSGSVATLARTPGEDDVRWIRVREPTAHAAGPADAAVYRVKLEVEGAVLGSLWGSRPVDAPEPGRSHARLLALTADQVALGLERERLAEAATGAEIARRSDRLKSALLDSVSHDLRTPLAGIRALAGGLMDPEVTVTREEQHRAAAAIDVEAQRLDRLVRDLLDASRIEAGALRPVLEAYDLAGLVEAVLDRMRPRLGDRPLEVALPDDLPPVRADGLFVEQVIANLLDNVVVHAGASAPVRVTARASDDATVTLTVEDGGVGLPDAELGRLFDRGGGTGRPAGGRVSLGLGTGIVRGLVEAMGGRVAATRSELGGVAVEVRLPLAEPPRDEP